MAIFILITISLGILFFTYWNRFDIPLQITKTNNPINRYSIKFRSTKRRYYAAKIIYICVIFIIYLVLLNVINFYAERIINFVSGFEIFKILNPKVIIEYVRNPISFALLITTLTQYPIINNGEIIYRSIFHAVAQIPQKTSKYISQLRARQFIEEELLWTQVKKFGLDFGKVNSEGIYSKIVEDELINIWLTVGGIILKIDSTNEARKIRINSYFLHQNKDELDGIKDKYRALFLSIKDRASKIYFNKEHKVNIEFNTISSLPEEIHALRDRMYMYVACGIIFSSVREQDIDNSFESLGFSGEIIPSKDGQMIYIISYAVIAFIFTFFINVIAVKYFYDYINYYYDNKPLPDKLKLFIPDESADIFAKTSITASFYVPAVIFCLYLRKSYLRAYEWFDINDTKREGYTQYPYEKYALPTLVSGAIGCACFTLAIIIYERINDRSSHIEQMLPWYPLAFFVSGCVLIVCDFNYDVTKSSFKKDILFISLCASIATFVVSFIFTHAVIATEFTNPLEKDIISTPVRFFIASQITVFCFMLFLLSRSFEVKSASFSNIFNKQLAAFSGENLLFVICLDKSGSVKRFHLNDGHESISGIWTHYPEGIVIKWYSSDDSEFNFPQLGLITSIKGMKYYYGHDGKISENPKFMCNLKSTFAVAETL